MRIEEKNNYIEVIFDAQESIIAYESEMILNNEIEGLLAATRKFYNGNPSFMYDTREKISLSRMGEGGRFSIQDYLQICLSLLHTVQGLKEYSLYGTGILLDQRYIFVDPRNMQCGVIYLPNGRKDIETAEFQKFFRELLFSSFVKIEDGRAVNEIVRVLNEAFANQASFVRKFEELQRTCSSDMKKPMREPAAPMQMPQIQVETIPQPMPIREESHEIQEEIEPEMPPAKKKPFGMSKKEKPEKKKTKEKKAKEKKAAGDGKKDRSGTILLLIGGIMLVGTAYLFNNGFFIGENGALDTSKLAGVLIIAFGLELLVYRKLKAGKEDHSEKFDEKARKKEAKKEKKKEKKAGKKKEKPVAKKQEYKKAKSPFASPKEEKPYLEEQREPAPERIAEQPRAIEPKRIEQPAFLYEQTAENDATEFWGGDGISGGNGMVAYLENAMGERHYLTLERMRIGKQAEKAEIVLKNTKVSRLHAEIYQKDGRFYLMDMHSSNGTYLNHQPQRLNACVDYELHSGDVVRFANEEYIFRMGY